MNGASPGKADDGAATRAAGSQGAGAYTRFSACGNAPYVTGPICSIPAMSNAFSSFGCAHLDRLR
eukprot:2305710-Pleurochrysis_carterae.AAC.1